MIHQFFKSQIAYSYILAVNNFGDILNTTIPIYLIII